MSIIKITDHSDAGNYKVETDEGATHHVPKTDNDAVERFGIQQWIDDGNISEYVAPEKSWAAKRIEEYNQLNQFELIGEDSINGTTKHKEAILAIKAKYPKE